MPSTGTAGGRSCCPTSASPTSRPAGTATTAGPATEWAARAAPRSRWARAYVMRSGGKASYSAATRTWSSCCSTRSATRRCRWSWSRNGSCSRRCPRSRRSVAPALGFGVHDRLLAALAGADPDRLLDWVDEHAAIADVPGARGLDDRVDRGLDHAVRHHRLDLDLRQQRDVGPSAAVLLGVALL